MTRLDDLVALRQRVDAEIQQLVPKAGRRTAAEWLLLLPPDPDAAQHRADLEAEVGHSQHQRRDATKGAA